MTKKTIEFEATECLSLQNSFGILKQEEVRLFCTIGINSDNYGWFEIYDIRTAGDEWYAEGGLWFEDKEVVDFDGVFDLPVCIKEKLKELGYSLEY